MERPFGSSPRFKLSWASGSRAFSLRRRKPESISFHAINTLWLSSRYGASISSSIRSSARSTLPLTLGINCPFFQLFLQTTELLMLRINHCGSDGLSHTIFGYLTYSHFLRQFIIWSPAATQLSHPSPTSTSSVIRILLLISNLHLPSFQAQATIFFIAGIPKPAPSFCFAVPLSS